MGWPSLWSTDPSRVESGLDPLADLPGDREVLVRRALGDDRDGDHSAHHRLGSGDHGFFEQVCCPLRRAIQLMGDLADQRQNGVQALGAADLDVHDRGRPSQGPVADLDDLAVADVPDDFAGVSHFCDAQCDLLNGADRLARVDDIAHAVLVLEDHEDAGQDVLDQSLCAKRERDPTHISRCQERSQWQAEGRHDRQQRNREDDEGRRALQD